MRTHPTTEHDDAKNGAVADFIESLSSFSRLHRAQRWEGTFGEFLANILPQSPAAQARTRDRKSVV